MLRGMTLCFCYLKQVGIILNNNDNSVRLITNTPLIKIINILLVLFSHINNRKIITQIRTNEGKTNLGHCKTILNGVLIEDITKKTSLIMF